MNQGLKRKAKHPPFVMAFKAILRNHKISPPARLLLLIIKSYADRSGVFCFPSQETLAADLGRSVPSIKRLINELRNRALITTFQRKTKTGNASTTAFMFNDEAVARLTIPRKKIKKPGITHDPRQVSPVIPGDTPKIVRFTEKKQSAG